MFPIQCEELRNNHLTALLVVTMPYACWLLWRVDYIDFKWRLPFQLGVAFWRVVLREVYFEGPNHIWWALKTSILNTCSESCEGANWYNIVILALIKSIIMVHSSVIPKKDPWFVFPHSLNFRPTTMHPWWLKRRPCVLNAHTYFKGLYQILAPLQR